MIPRDPAQSERESNPNGEGRAVRGFPHAVSGYQHGPKPSQRLQQKSTYQPEREENRIQIASPGLQVID